MSNDPGGGDGIGRLFVRLLADAKRLLRAEIGVVRVRLTARIADARTPLLLLVAAALLAQAGLVALLVGLVLALAMLVGPLLATLIVVSGTLGLAGILATIGVRRLRPKIRGAKP